MSVEIFNGNEILVQGAKEAGFHLYTGYPGSPLADFFNILYSQRKSLQDKGIKVAIANSEANAAAMASGAKQAGKNCLVAMKSMGLHVASDALSVGNFANPGPDDQSNGVVVVVGDDPWSMSTSTPADSRYLFKHLHIPFLEPSTPQELKDWMKIALEISKKTSLYQGLLLTTFMAEGGGRIEVGLEQKVESNMENVDPKSFDLSKNVMVPPNSLMADVRMIKERFPKVEKVLEQLRLDKTFGQVNSEIGIISSGVVFETVKQILEEAQILDRVSLYKVGCSYPLVTNSIKPWIESKKSIIVVEEKRGFLETELREVISRYDLNTKVVGKMFGEIDGFPSYGGLDFETISSKLTEALKILGHNFWECDQSSHFDWDKPLPKRLPTFCPGCPHRETLSVLKVLRKTLEGSGVDLISHGDVGCYSLSFLPPFGEMHNLSAMGQGGALGAGFDLFTKNPSVVLMGDSTFFHSGITDISNSVQCDHNITYILLDNDNTAMTGHQMTPASKLNVEGRVRPKQDILNSVKALGVKEAIEINPSDRYFYQNLLLDYAQKPGVKVIVSTKECGLTFQGKQKALERSLFKDGKVLEQKDFFQINTDACEDCRECVTATGCPGLSQTEDAYGTKVFIDPQICVSDGYCTKVKACPSFEKITVNDYHPTKYKSTESKLSFDQVKDPVIVKSFEDISKGNDWRVVVTGVGGSGVTTISRVLAQAAKEMNGRDDLDFKFMDQKGLAQRNGNVTGHLSIYQKSKSASAITPLGTADLLLSPDLLDGAGQIKFLGKESLAIFDEQFQVPLSLLLDKGEKKSPLTELELQRKLKHKLSDQVHFYQFKALSYEKFGKSVYASAMLLGAAFQSGRLPFSLDNMKNAFNDTMKKGEFENNWNSFNLGRIMFDSNGVSENRTVDTHIKDLDLLKKSLKDSLFYFTRKNTIIKKFEKSCDQLFQIVPGISKSYLARYVYDCFIYDRGKHIETFIDDAKSLSKVIDDYEHLKMALRILAKTYFIKDEVFISHQMIAPLKLERDHDYFSQLGSSFEYSFINRPSFTVFGKDIAFDFSPRPWMLRVMRHARFLRKILSRWHVKEKQIAISIRRSLLGIDPEMIGSKRYQFLKSLENVKGYREIRYKNGDFLNV